MLLMRHRRREIRQEKGKCDQQEDGDKAIEPALSLDVEIPCNEQVMDQEQHEERKFGIPQGVDYLPVIEPGKRRKNRYRL